MENFKWIDFYTEFATKLLEYKNNRPALIEKIVIVFNNIGMKMPKLDNTGIPVDIDPFTVFGLFNKGIKDSNRVKILEGISEEFGINATTPDDFSGIPILNNLMATFYAFAGDDRREEDDINNLWGTFAAAVDLAEKDNDDNRMQFIAFYELARKQFAIKWNLTMGLYWIRPYKFVNLDSTNREFMSDSDNIPEEVASIVRSLKNPPDAITYLSIMDNCEKAVQSEKYGYSSFPELSYKAWVVAEEKAKAEKDIKSGKSKAEFLRWFKPLIQALRELGGSAIPSDARQRIIENENLSNEEVNETRGKTNVNKFENEVAFARSYLVKGGYISNAVHGVWTLTEKGMSVEMTDDLASQIFKDGVAANVANSTKNKQHTYSVDADVNTVNYWVYAPGEGAVMWEEFYNNEIMGLGWHELENLELYNTKAEIVQKLQEINNDNRTYRNSAHAVWQFVHDLKPGDVIFAKRGKSEVIGKGIVESDYEYNEEYDENYPNIRKVRWTHKGSWNYDGNLPMKTLTDVTIYNEFVNKLNSFFEDEIENSEDYEEAVIYEPYTSQDFLDEVYLDEDSYNNLVGILKAKKNIILQGAPGVGKTFAAKRLAYSIMGVKDIERVMTIQFHQSYSYEDFIMGFRPSENGFVLKKGVFYNFCKKADEDSENEYFFIIDEINRGNLSKIFGELFMLIENDKRGIKNKLQLLYSDEMFYIPENVYIIGMMNTADRSLAMLDYALRRRFAFFDLKPGFDSAGFNAYKDELNNEKFNALIQCVKDLNEEIRTNESLGEGFCIGHSYFCNIAPNEVTDDKLRGIFEYEIIPMLKEYWFDEPVKLKNWSDKLRSAVK